MHALKDVLWYVDQTTCDPYCLFITDFLFLWLSVITDTLHYHLHTCINRANLGGRSYDFDSMFRYANWRVITRTTRYGWNIKKKIKRPNKKNRYTYSRWTLHECTILIAISNISRNYNAVLWLQTRRSMQLLARARHAFCALFWTDLLFLKFCIILHFFLYI